MSENTKLEKIINLFDSYLWVISGSHPEDDYSIRDEDDFEEFKEELEKLL